MIRHIVLVRFPAKATPAAIAAIFADLGGLRDVVPGFLRFGSGVDVSVEGLSRGFTHAFEVDLVDADARDAYLVHPAHKAAGARLVAAVEGGVDGILVLDLKIPAP